MQREKYCRTIGHKNDITTSFLLCSMKKDINSFSANPEKWSNALKQIVTNLPTICLSVFDHFMNSALKGLSRETVKRNRMFGKVGLDKLCFQIAFITSA